MKKILISGGSGLIGAALTDLLVSKGYLVNHLSRTRNSKGGVKVWLWDTKKQCIEPGALKDVSVIVHLAGANIGVEKQDEKGKQALQKSRVDTAKLLHSEVLKKSAPLELFLSASAIGYYGTGTNDKLYTETDKPGSDFISELTVKWEQASDIFQNVPRVVKFRIGLVLDKNEGALPKIAFPAQFGLGTPLGSGKQWVPWIHIQDLARMFLFGIENAQIKGVYNTVSNDHVNNRYLTKALTKALAMPMILPKIPGSLLKLFLGDRASLLLSGKRVSGKKIKDEGFEFTYENVNDALENIYSDLRDYQLSLSERMFISWRDMTS